MNKDEAIQFFILHAKWLKEQWSLTPEGRAYQEMFLAAIEAVKK